MSQLTGLPLLCLAVILAEYRFEKGAYNIQSCLIPKFLFMTPYFVYNIQICNFQGVSVSSSFL